MKRLKFAFAWMAVLGAPSAAHAGKGTVVAICSAHHLISSSQGYAIIEWYGGNSPSRGDVIVGDFQSYGMKDVFNLSQDSDVRVWVDDFWMSKDRAVEKFSEKCR